MRLTVTLFVAFLLLVVGTITQAQPPQAPSLLQSLGLQR